MVTFYSHFLIRPYSILNGATVILEVKTHCQLVFSKREAKRERNLVFGPKSDFFVSLRYSSSKVVDFARIEKAVYIFLSLLRYEQTRSVTTFSQERVLI